MFAVSRIETAVNLTACLPVGLYAISQDGEAPVYLGSANFIDAVAAKLSAGAKVRGCFAQGSFDSTTDLLKAGAVALVLD